MAETPWLHMSADIHAIVMYANVCVFVCLYSVIRILPMNEVMKNAFDLINHFECGEKKSTLS